MLPTWFLGIYVIPGIVKGLLNKEFETNNLIWNEKNFELQKIKIIFLFLNPYLAKLTLQNSYSAAQNFDSPYPKMCSWSSSFWGFISFSLPLYGFLLFFLRCSWLSEEVDHCPSHLTPSSPIRSTRTCTN